MKSALAGLLIVLCMVGFGCHQPAAVATHAPATAPTATQQTATPTTAPTATAPADPQAKARRILELNQISGQAYNAKQYSKALEAITELVTLTPDNSGAWYNLACMQSLLGKTDDALNSLERSIKLGYSELQHMQRDPDLVALRNLPRYQSIVQHRDQIQRDRADKVLDALRKRLGEAYTYEIDHAHRMVYASSVDARDFADIKEHLTAYEAAEAKTIFDHSPDQYIAVVIPKNYSRAPGQPGGFYEQTNKVLVVGSIGMVLTHEFTHAMHGADQEALGQTHPIWICEGFATTFESSEIRNGLAVPLRNHRLNILQELIRRKRTIPLEQFVKLDPMTFQRGAMVSYPECRYLLIYLHEKGLLKKWYDSYVSTFEKDSTGALALETVTGKKLPQLEEDWKAWVMTLTPLPVGVQTNGAYVGVQVAPATDGLLVKRVVPGSGADQAGLREGDIITRLDGQRMVDPESLTLLVTARKVGQELPIEYRRDGKYENKKVLLMAKPADVQPSTPSSHPKPNPIAGNVSCDIMLVDVDTGSIIDQASETSLWLTIVEWVRTAGLCASAKHVFFWRNAINYATY